MGTVEWLWIRAGAQDRERATGSERTQQVDKLDNKVAVVSGAARGQGRSHAVTLAAEGASIIALDICADIEGNTYPLSRREDLESSRV